MRAQVPGPRGSSRRAAELGQARPRPSGAASLVIGLGNPLRSDDGIGWRLAAQLPARAGLVVRCRQQLTPELAEDLAAAERVLLLDACLGPQGPEGGAERQGGAAKRRLPPAPPPLVLQEIPAPLDQSLANGAAGIWAGAEPWGGASHGLSPQALLALSQALYGRAPRAQQLLLPGHHFGHGQGLSLALARRLGEARGLINGWIAAGLAGQGDA